MTKFAIISLFFALIGLPSLAYAQTTSEEDPPLTCNTDTFLTGLTCSGSFCDDVGIRCSRSTGRSWGANAQFEEFFSEEGNGFKECPSGHAIAGLACNGGFCDNISLLCVRVAGPTLANCGVRSGSVSEEGDGRLVLLQGRIANGMTCIGSNCDNKQLISCR